VITAPTPAAQWVVRAPIAIREETAIAPICPVLGQRPIKEKVI
jgi:hypothetical protein